MGKQFTAREMEESRGSVSMEKEEEAENGELLKRKISDHPLFGKLVENHLNCLQVGDINHTSKDDWINQREVDHQPHYGVICHSELDSFMEAYCLALSKLKEAMEEPQLETVAFFNSIHSQLRELKTTSPEPTDRFLVVRLVKKKPHTTEENLMTRENDAGIAKWDSNKSTHPDGV